MNRNVIYWMSTMVLLTILLEACALPPAVETSTPESVETEMVETEGSPTAPPKPSVSQVSLPMVDPGAVTGDIIAAGSSTVYPLSEAIAERFEGEGYTGKITIDSIGSGAGFERFCGAGETDIANASRRSRAKRKPTAKPSAAPRSSSGSALMRW